MNKQIAKDLLSIQAVRINLEQYFTWTSGLKAPIYCDNRLTISYPKIREQIVQAFQKLMKKNSLEIDVIAGCATAGIPHAAFLAQALQLPMVYVRSNQKKHGKKNQIEGVLEKNQRVLLIEDLISTGGSALQAAKALKEAGADVKAIFSIVSYELTKAKKQFEKDNFLYDTITTFDEIVNLLLETDKITKEQRHTLVTWRDNI